MTPPPDAEVGGVARCGRVGYRKSHRHLAALTSPAFLRMRLRWIDAVNPFGRCARTSWTAWRAESKSAARQVEATLSDRVTSNRAFCSAPEGSRLRGAGVRASPASSRP